MNNSRTLAPARTHTYINVMECLVAEEVERQLKKLPKSMEKYVKRFEIETFALNRLPSLYATSEKGLQHQHKRAMTELQPHIIKAVRQAFITVQADPLRISEPLQIPENSQEAEAVLQVLRQWTNTPNLNWSSALNKLQGLFRHHFPVPEAAYTSKSVQAFQAPENTSSSSHQFQNAARHRVRVAHRRL